MRSISLVTNAILLVVSAAILLGAVVIASLMTLPDVRDLEKCFTTNMYHVHLCPGTANYAKLKEISPYVLHAVIVSEDGAFYSHKGFDWHEIEESLNADLRTGKIQRGGSTLTQQLAKNAFLDKDKSLWRKLKEAYLAHAIETHYKKDFILEKYLNVVEFGPELYGVKPAALHYFHKTPSELNPLEAAYLAHLLPNPKVYSRTFRTGQLTPFSRKIVGIILKRMEAYGKLSPDAYRAAADELPNFPWSGVSSAAFSGGAQNYSLDATAHPTEHDVQAEEEVLDELYREDSGGQGGDSSTE